MTPSELISAFITGVLVIAALSLIVAPGGQAPAVLNAFGTNFASIIQAAKNYPK
jgi:hypothetical protein